ncbi:MAG: LysM peptidoglycan-binding domain-containing protein [Trichlorobacter sp.]|uniref:LysM peptidoglycan-binding domain-containing protein n=1 Tax=Trichlorobacter sp. TaxID=2911007 RepID=UPI002562D68E|nr:LysM peptidoglycan-binding domain-containing protein [Trichlorobacter sp.]MDK9717968.1 LysM peptidoglycan-binding domain-containing protein [Trichlorobacter sp.]
MHLPGVKIPLLMALLLCGVTASWGADYLYSPQPFNGEAGEGVLVREVTVKKGDNLSRISKKYSGRDYYYPQILLFNEIKNPHWIQIGQVLRVPVSRKVAAKYGQQSAGEKPEQKSLAHELTVDVPKKRSEKQRPPAGAQGEYNAYNRGLEAYKKGDCEAAIALFDQFISRYPSSALLPEATLNRAECYLKLSAK